jgi:Cys-rich protein (TIGR01571 family)
MRGVGTSIIMTEGTSLLSSYGSYATPVDPYLSRTDNGGSAAAKSSSLGEWSTSLYDCCRHGPCHPVLCNATCCPLVLAAQVMTRLQLNPLAEPSPNYRRTFYVVLLVVIAYWALSMWLAPPNPLIGHDNDDTNEYDYHWDAAPGRPRRVAAVSWWRTGSYNGLYVAFAVYTWYVLTKLRAAVRLRHQIPAQSASVPGCVEDACVSFWCGCCSVAQLARQTASYNDDDDDDEGAEAAACCTPTGLRMAGGGEMAKDSSTFRSTARFPATTIMTV